MNRLLVYLGRFASITFGFLCATLAASAFLHLLVFGGLIFNGEEIDPEFRFPAPLTILFVSLLIGYWSFPSAMVFIAITELTAWRSWLFHACAGAAVALLATLIAAGGNPFRNDADIMMALVASGMIGGIAYWAVAGRHAGEWLHGKDGATDQS